jgi:hypothetical protein
MEAPKQIIAIAYTSCNEAVDLINSQECNNRRRLSAGWRGLSFNAMMANESDLCILAHVSYFTTTISILQHMLLCASVIF